MSIGFLWFRVNELSNQKIRQESHQADKTIKKKEILRFALVADSENDNSDLEKALSQARGAGATFVIMLGDLTKLGEVGDLLKTKAVFDKSQLPYYVTAGDHDLWDSRNRGDRALNNFEQIFGNPSQVFDKSGVEFLIIDNSDIYKGISDTDWDLLNSTLGQSAKLEFVFSHKTPYHPQSSHIMGNENKQVAKQAEEYLNLLENRKVDGFFSGDLHFFAEYKSPNNTVKITTVGAIDSERNFQGPRFAMVKVYSDYSWDTQDLEIK
jgi:predicted phosphodiesterase